jgi:hypothetical protein
MGRITSGGLKGIKSIQKLNNTEPVMSSSSTTESYTDYAKRNIAKVPAMAYELGRSGLGLGNLLNFIGERSQQAGQGYLQQYPQAIQQASQGLSNLGQLARRTILPTGQEANREAQTLASLLPGATPERIRYATEHRPEDYPAEFALMELPRIIASAGSGGIPGAAKALGRSLGLFGGSEAGHVAGGALGELLGDRQVGELAGGLAGGHYGQKLANVAMNRPGKFFPEKVRQAEEGAFEQNKLQRLSEIEKEYTPKIREQEEAARKAYLELPKEKAGFEAAKKDQINSVKKDINDFRNKIKTLDQSRKPAYDMAAKLENNAKGNASGILNAIKEIEDDVRKGVAKADRKSIYDSLNDLEQSVNKGKGELSLREAKQFQKNFNDQIYNFGASNSFKRQMNKATAALNDFIKNTGSEEHNSFWQKGEQATRELKELKRNEKDFLRGKQQIISDLSKEKFSPEKEAILRRETKEATEGLKNLRNQKEATIDAIGKETYDKLLKSEESQNKLISSITKLVNSGLGKYGISGLATALGYFTYGKKGALVAGLGTKLAHGLANEVRLTKDVFNKHPELYKQYAKEISKMGTKDLAASVLRINQLGQKVEQYSKSLPQEENKPKKGITKGGLKFGV